MTYDDTYTRYYNRIQQYIFFKLSDRDLAHDLAQTTFLRLWQNWETVNAFEHETQLAWLFRVASNLVKDCLRRRRVLTWSSLDALSDEVDSAPHEPVEEDFTEALCEHLSLQESIAQAFEVLRPTYRIPLHYAYVEQLDNKEIAQRLGIRADAVKCRLMRARRQFQVVYKRGVA